MLAGAVRIIRPVGLDLFWCALRLTPDLMLEGYVIILARATLGCDSPVGRVRARSRGSLCRMVVVKKTAGVSERLKKWLDKPEFGIIRE